MKIDNPVIVKGLEPAAMTVLKATLEREILSAAVDLKPDWSNYTAVLRYQTLVEVHGKYFNYQTFATAKRRLTFTAAQGMCLFVAVCNVGNLVGAEKYNSDEMAYTRLVLQEVASQINRWVSELSMVETDIVEEGGVI